ncbi:YceD family protein [Lacticaseibacillus kribbianus]|uniref:YceD family protein n=1 Tax=Lacticaseibacillus kribbianus TaxID=2926292 RepID=UPI001CD62507|nr:YceD family protein [Lacticaseibacillus kribbianus]
MLKWSLADLMKHRSAPLTFSEVLALEDELTARDPEILSVSPVAVSGEVRFSEGDFIATVSLKGKLVIPSTRSLTPVDWPLDFTFSEVYVTADSDREKYDDGQLLIDLDGDALDLMPAVTDHILLAIPMQVLTPAEAETGEMPTGTDWAVVSEDEYEATHQDEKPNPAFAKLQGLFPEDDGDDK